MATLYTDLRLDPVTGDLDVSEGLKLVETNVESLRQRLWMRFNVWSGDWYFDETLGFPYRTYISRKVIKSILDNKIKEFVQEEQDVLGINSFTSTMDRVGRSYMAYFEVTTREQEIVRLAFSGSDSYYFPKPTDATASLCDDQGWVQWANKLYQLINFRLPATGDATWVNQWK